MLCVKLLSFFKTNKTENSRKPTCIKNVYGDEKNVENQKEKSTQKTK